jgi:hypothetical protein
VVQNTYHISGFSAVQNIAYFRKICGPDLNILEDQWHRSLSYGGELFTHCILSRTEHFPYFRTSVVQKTFHILRYSAEYFA